MRTYNSKNERVKKGYLRFLKEADRKSDSTITRPQGDFTIRSLHGAEGLLDLQPGTGCRLQEATGQHQR